MTPRADSPPRVGRGPSVAAGVAVAAAAVALTTALVYPLREVAPVVSLGVVYLVAVLLVSSVWGLWLGVATAIAGALAFNFFHIPPTGRFLIRDGENWVALGVFVVAAVVSSKLAEQARVRADEAEERRREADLAAEMARLLLREEDLSAVMPTVGQRLAGALRLRSAAIELQPVEGDDRRLAFALREGAAQIGTLLVPRDTPEPTLRRVQERVVPALEALLAIAREREEMTADVVEARALRRSDVLKTALLRTVTHDLRSPLTAILTGVEPLTAEHVDDADRRELAQAVRGEAQRLARLIENLLDLSRLEAQAAAPRADWCSIEEVMHAALDSVDAPRAAFRLVVGDDIPFVRADAAQLERAFANLLENAARHASGHPVSVRLGGLHNRVMVRIVDRGPGIPPAQRERVFEPFYRAGTDRTGHRGSGLGLAIARGFLEVNGGKVWVESLPGQSTTFVVELPLEREPAPAAAPEGGLGRNASP
jgi:two-component system sensor histidine kinase KdpD